MQTILFLSMHRKGMQKKCPREVFWFTRQVGQEVLDQFLSVQNGSVLQVQYIKSILSWKTEAWIAKVEITTCNLWMCCTRKHSHWDSESFSQQRKRRKCHFKNLKTRITCFTSLIAYKSLLNATRAKSDLKVEPWTRKQTQVDLDDTDWFMSSIYKDSTSKYYTIVEMKF